MSYLVGIIITLLILMGFASLYSAFKSKLNFYITGLDSGFSFVDLSTLWETSQTCDLEDPNSLFVSNTALNKCMTQIQSKAKATGNDKSPRYLLLMSKLFDFKTKIQNEADNKKGLASTKSLEKGQKLRIILPGKGVFYSELVNNGSSLIINVPKQKDLIPISGEEWVGKVISVYLWRKGDARYVFDTTVEDQAVWLGKSALQLKHSYNLVRTQKRKSVRSACEIYGQLFIVKKNDATDSIETKNGYKCLIEDISESGALIRIGGKEIENIKIKLQFSIQNKLILMNGVIRSVEFNPEDNQSLLHFECTRIDPIMKNEILAYVYNMLPQNEKEILEAIAQTEDDVDLEDKINDNIDANITETDGLQESQTPQETENSQNIDITQNSPISENKVDTSVSTSTQSEIELEDELNIF